MRTNVFFLDKHDYCIVATDKSSSPTQYAKVEATGNSGPVGTFELDKTHNK